MWEWETVLQYFATNPNVNQTLTVNGDFHYFSNSINPAKFQNAFKLPFAGNRNYSDASLGYQGSRGYYWSSSPVSASSNSARNLYLNSSNVYANNNHYRANGLSVRCFKDSPDAPETKIITFNENG